MKINKKYLIVLYFLISGVGFTSAHPFYVSICQVKFNSETSLLEVSLKIFTDDLIKGLENAGHRNLYIGEEKEDAKTDVYLFDYIKSKLQFTVNGKKEDYRFLGKEIDEAVVWSYFEIPGITDFESINVQCSLLLELYDTQNNIIQVEKDKEIKNLLLNNKNTVGTIAF